jgi:hypothetical protein
VPPKAGTVQLPPGGSAAAAALTSILISINRHHQIDGAGIKITGAPKSDD